MTPVPTVAQVSAAWLSDVLAAAGCQHAQVANFKLQPIGTGQTGACARISLVYASPDATGPTSLVLKYPSDNALSRDSAVAMGIYRREVEFYRDIAPRLHIALPRIYFQEVDDAGERFLILMEDLAPAVQGDQLTGCSPAVAREAVLQLVGLQAPTWCDVALGQRFLEPEDGFFSDMHGLYNQMLPAFCERFGANLAADELAIIQRLGASKSAPLFMPLDVHGPEPYCLEHRDYRLDNLMVDDSVTPPRVTVVDWQGMRTGRPLNDVALCLAGGLQPQARQAEEQGILKAYHQSLLAAGVPQFDWEQCWQAYRQASFAGFGLTVIAAIAVEQTERGDAMFTAMAQRHARHALDLNASEFLV